jgi:ankyrin repeat protein
LLFKFGEAIMPWRLDIAGRLDVAFKSDDLHSFRQLLIDHPDNLYNSDEADYWMQKAVMRNKLHFIVLLVELGADVNRSAVPSNQGNAFNQPEGPILWAASEGHTEIVRWLLDHSAMINHVVNGKPRCLPLIYAATGGHFEVVKLLVEHGADVHATWDGLNAAEKAKDYGHFAIHEYLIAQPKV